ncbi:glycosyltransferase family 2 protein [Schleiferia thermophila]|jgi:cellulose synthase/poly-beta-1,6-N-acetylglucosamine synthase-like glycosyltransferase|uniref:Cellulose synthase/poly-beta-1,6-N-acetylglucosamine synthase-like glycosyltransferase n=1 Tax=Schleiferia thermophila TaxID=884107 RepID=A0A369A0W7_9FLAO|nr:glycosyltransferase family 2 protein [Schleiferia thermophila]KFD38708.1 glycosyl transferase [Schleiferia thermophila str. Yellowstone]RCX02078.1 cellulose synthase/poly-beta-1,6-N-acetylglucosamine synthase-like glycosyltransferase [Schleiferia thermophila]GCD80600.1 glycosyl transferase [Schleiferia thermophila]
METVFWLLLFIVFYAYVGYGMILFILLRIKRLFSKKTTPERNEVFEPTVTLVVPAYNEEDFILKKVENCLQLDYPKDKFEIIFITDGSTDRTKELLEKDGRVKVLHEDRRAGKAAAENRAMRFVKSDIVVFCDANTLLNKNAIRELVKHYKDPEVGAVSGEKRIMNQEAEGASAAGEGLYWKYESTLKKMDSEMRTVVGAAGELISFRTDLVEDLEEDTILDDFMQSMRIALKGYRVIYEPEAYAMETASADVKEELKRKVRICAGGWQSMSRLLPAFNVFRHPLLTFLYTSHRVLRWSIAAFVLPIIFILNIFLANRGGVYVFLLIAQIIFYVLALLGWYLQSKKMKVKLLFVPFYFTLMNYAVFAGFFRWLRGTQKATWERARRATI